MCDSKEKCMTILEDDRIEEKYTGHHTSSYVGLYTTDGRTCNCSRFGAHLFCRQIIFYRKQKIFQYLKDKFFQSKRFNGDSDDHASSDLEVDDVDRIDDIDADDNNVATPASPGMDHLLREQRICNFAQGWNVLGYC